MSSLQSDTDMEGRRRPWRILLNVQLILCRIVIQMQFAFRLPRLFSVSGSNLRKITRFCISKTNLHQTQMDLALCLRAWYNKYLDQVLMRKGEAESSDDK